MELTEAEQQRERGLENKWTELKDLWDNSKIPNISPEFQKERRKNKGLKSIWRSNNCKLPKLASNINQKIQKEEWIPARINPKKPMPRHIIIKPLKTKNWNKNRKAAREKLLNIYREWIPIQIAVDFSSETIEARTIWHIFQMQKEKNCQPQLSSWWKYPSGVKRKWRHFQAKEYLSQGHLSLKAD